MGKKTKPFKEKVMMVRDADDEEWRPRVVIAKKQGYFVAWCNAEVLKEAGFEYETAIWKQAIEVDDFAELHRSDICKSLNVKGFNLISD